MTQPQECCGKFDNGDAGRGFGVELPGLRPLIIRKRSECREREICIGNERHS